MIFYDTSLNRWVRKPGLSTATWDITTIPIGGIYILPILFCSGADVAVPSYTTMSLTIKLAGQPLTSAIATASAEYVDGNGAVVFEIDMSGVSNQEEDQTSCFLQVQYEVDALQYLTTLQEVILQNNYTL